MSPTVPTDRAAALHDAAAILRAPVPPTREMWARLTALVDAHGLSKREMDSAPARVVALGEVRDTDRIVTVQTDGTVVRQPVRAVEQAGTRRVVRFGERGLAAINARPDTPVLVERD